MLTLLAGVVLGFVGSIPAAGPLLALVIVRGLQARRRDALALALGGALAESGYVALAFWGHAHVIEGREALARWATLASGALLVAFGGFLLRRRAGVGATRSTPTASAGHFAAGFTIVALNPAFLAFWSVVASALHGAGVPIAAASPVLLAVGALCGVVLWFALVAGIAQRQRERFAPERLAVVVRVLGGVVVLFGCWLLLRALLHTP